MTREFPKGFLWGTATAAHQVEGNNIHSDWWEWEKIPGKIKKNERSGIACDHWGRFEVDLSLMRELGVNAYRFSIEWAKIEPREGEMNDEAIRHYQNVVRLLLGAGIEPLITLHHFTSPRWWAERGLWAAPGAATAFCGYAKLVYREIAAECTRFTTVNEPLVHLGGAYVLGLTPPEKKGFLNLKAPLVGMLECHRDAYWALHADAAERGRKIDIGMAHHVRVFDPKRRWNPVDILTAGALDRAFNWTLPDALETGKLRMKIPGLVNIDLEIPGLARTQDSFGLNYYSRDLVTLGFKDGRLEPVLSPKSGRPTNDLGWELYPEGFLRSLRRVHERYPRLSVLVTENGIADHADRNRSEFIREHVDTLSAAVSEGIPVTGYLYWSLLDNFEWIEGFDPRFGLVEMDYRDLSRKPRPSFYKYRDLIRAHAPSP